MEGDIIVGELDMEEMPVEHTPHSTKFRHNEGIVRQDVDEIVKGAFPRVHAIPNRLLKQNQIHFS